MNSYLTGIVLTRCRTRHILSLECSDIRTSCFPSRQSNSLHLPLITSLVPHSLHLVLTPFSPAAPPLANHMGDSLPATRQPANHKGRTRFGPTLTTQTLMRQ
ncbi:hypothetical protein EYF80_013835 [Liparis tanakae]|uniref:Uncharacterized protein n=1 Tax=Liparis tanakae TaxID=230148 RepID=A0A4Z2IE86_9TELE|nr:hypothetical protein EYF80_013835 [Liparis tanakae]